MDKNIERFIMKYNKTGKALGSGVWIYTLFLGTGCDSSYLEAEPGDRKFKSGRDELERLFPR